MYAIANSFGLVYICVNVPAKIEFFAGNYYYSKIGFHKKKNNYCRRNEKQLFIWGLRHGAEWAGGKYVARRIKDVRIFRKTA